MIDSSTIVQTAISSFNNSALLSPSFFWSFLLMLPIFFLFFIKRNEIKSNLTKFKLTKKDPNFSFVLDVILLFYLTVMSGNYDTIRNSITFIPFIIAFVLFLIIASITNFLYKNDLINSFLKKHKKISILLVLLFLALSSYCGHPSILGFILNPAS